MASDDSDLFNVAMLIDELKVRVRQAREDAMTSGGDDAAPFPASTVAQTRRV